jgi:hypothetical protein
MTSLTCNWAPFYRLVLHTFCYYFSERSEIVKFDFSERSEKRGYNLLSSSYYSFHSGILSPWLPIMATDHVHSLWDQMGQDFHWTNVEPCTHYADWRQCW